MAAQFFHNGVSIGSSAGWCGFTGSNNYVVRYGFTTGPQGADCVSLELTGIYYGNGAGTQAFGFRVSESSVAYADARNITPDSDYGVMSYGESGWGCTLTARGLNLLPGKSYYLFVYVATAGTEYYSGWNCVSPAIVCSGSFVPPTGSVSSVTALVSTESPVSIVLSDSPCPFHRAEFYAGDTLLGRSGVFTGTLSHVCPRSWFSVDRAAVSLSISVRVQGYADKACTAAQGEPMGAVFTLRADPGMCPSITEEAVSLAPLNEGAAAAFESLISGISRVKVSFDVSKVDLAACAGAEITGYALSIRNERRSSPEPVLESGVINGESTVVCTVTDSRGREGSVSLRLSPLPYVPPSLSVYEAARCDEDGSSNVMGEYYKLRFVSAVTDVEGKNRCSVSVKCRSSGGDWGGETVLTDFEDGVWSDNWAAPLVLGGAMQGDSYSLSLTVTDALGCASRYTLGLYHQRWAMKFNEKGTALGIGMEPAAENALQLPDSWRLYAGAIVLSENSYGYQEPENAVAQPVQGQLYFLLTE